MHYTAHGHEYNRAGNPLPQLVCAGLDREATPGQWHNRSSVHIHQSGDNHSNELLLQAEGTLP